MTILKSKGGQVMEELKKCKDCGAEAQLISCNLGYFVECSKLGHLHNGEKIYKTPAEAIAAWNRRFEG